MFLTEISSSESPAMRRKAFLISTRSKFDYFILKVSMNYSKEI
jgi:hypothetical protein